MLDRLFLDKETKILRNINKQANIVNDYMSKKILIDAQEKLLELENISKEHKSKARVFIDLISNILWLK